MVMILGMNGIAVARNGPILWENDATGSRKVFRGFRGFWEAIKSSKFAAKVRKCKSREKSRETKSSQNGAGLVGKMSGHLGGAFLDYLEAPSSNIRQQNLTDFITEFN